MGFSSTSGGGGGSSGMASDKASVAAPSQGHSFGDQLLGFMQQHYPVIGGLANMAFGSSQPTQPTAGGMVPPVAPSPEMTNIQQPDYSNMIGMNAQPKQSGGGLSTILKLFAGGA